MVDLNLNKQPSPAGDSISEPPIETNNPDNDNNNSNSNFNGPGNVTFHDPSDRYLKSITLGSGTYGTVYKALDTHTNQTVAVKKIHLGRAKEGVNVTALREIKLLKELKDPHIIRLLDAFPHKQNLHIVFEFMESDLETVIKDRNIHLSPADIKSYMQMTLKGLAVCHKKWILHRDMKPNNLLISADGELKLGDFGLARLFGSPNRRFTHQVFALWYRAPELLYGAKHYGPGVDMWAVGCIFAELVLRKPFLPGNSDLDQLGKIFQAFGTPKTSQWPDMHSLPDFVEFQHCPPQPLRSLFPMATEDTLDLLSKMFAFDPKQRISAQQALEHRYFSSAPAATRPDLLPKPSKATKPSNPESPKPILLSPSKARRVMLFPGESGSGGSTLPFDMPADRLRELYPPKSRITDSGKKQLKRKTKDMAAALDECAKESGCSDTPKHVAKRERRL